FKVPAGTTYTVKETDTQNYTASVALVENGTTVTNKGAADTITAAVAGEKKNTVTFTNTKNSDVLTGVLTENAPFIAMVAAAVLALVGYVAVRRRKAN
ncbi:MAG: hypothetical protein IJ192_04115, partial [Clostridia bacterium]|nr:hypothetical protein [Clostridia bacterium]